jgi:hypothetical protein
MPPHFESHLEIRQCHYQVIRRLSQVFFLLCLAGDRTQGLVLISRCFTTDVHLYIPSPK